MTVVVYAALSDQSVREGAQFVAYFSHEGAKDYCPIRFEGATEEAARRRAERYRDAELERQAQKADAAKKRGEALGTSGERRVSLVTRLAEARSKKKAAKHAV